MPYFAIALLLFVYSTLAWHFSQHVGDDGFIFYRYAENLAAGFGPLWNAGEPPVEGFSSPLWLGLLALCDLLGAPVPVAGKYLGILFGFLSLISLMQFTKILGRGSVAVWLTIAASFTAGLHYWSPAGLETTLYLLLWILALTALDKRSLIWTVSLLGLVRPEGPALVLAWCVADAYLSGRLHIKRYALLLIPTFIWLIFRVTYYGAWLPNTYFAKTGGDTLQQLRSGFHYALIPSIAWALCLLAAGRRRDRFSVILLSLIGFQLAIVIGGGGDWMANGRMLVPAFVSLWAFVVWNGRFEKILAAGAVYCLSLSWPSVTTYRLLFQGEQLPVSMYQEGSLVSATEELVEHIVKVTPPGSTIAVNHAGALPYFLSDYHFIDITGLNDKHISSVAGGLHQKFDSDYVLSKKPDGVVLNTRARPDQGEFALNYWVGEIDLAQHPEFQQNYRPLIIADSAERPVLFVSRLARGGTRAYMVYFVRINP